ncbi:outer membrane beta-barrel protein [Spirosoma sp. HMF4905]|uniref:Outer membrane beta-barrel protein n=1 Tax=Spirosoma arboris TaxID=2682092 RepID=A0A7K1SQS1_9BACT|nr:outer membrane beta-barrel protein [Spirosoma arboris]MVM36142.1 outer membrane beta-barrel protein [Spirosoma arboris]
MKALCTTLIVFCSALTSLKAQESSLAKANPVKFGVFAGLNYTNDVSAYSGIKSLSSFLAGVDIQYTLTNRTSLHLQPSWTQAESESNQAALSISTFKLPLLYRYYISPNQKQFFVQAGFGYNYLTNSNLRLRYDIYCIQAPCPNLGPDTPSSNKSAVSGMAGIGYTIELGKISVPITLQYERNLSNYEFSPASWLDPSKTAGGPTRVQLESFALTTGINF